MYEFFKREILVNSTILKYKTCIYQKESLNDKNWKKMFVVHLTDKTVLRMCKKNYKSVRQIQTMQQEKT